MHPSVLLCRVAERLCSAMEKFSLALMGIPGVNRSSLWLCPQTRLLFWWVVDAAKLKAVRGANVSYQYGPGSVLCVRLLLLGVAPDHLQKQWKDCFLPCSPTSFEKGFCSRMRLSFGLLVVYLFYHLLLKLSRKINLESNRNIFPRLFFFFFF